MSFEATSGAVSDSRYRRLSPRVSAHAHATLEPPAAPPEPGHARLDDETTPDIIGMCRRLIRKSRPAPHHSHVAEEHIERILNGWPSLPTRTCVNSAEPKG